VKRTGVREAALKIIFKAFEQQGYPNLLLDKALSSEEYTARDRALITRLVYGVLENKIYLDWVINRFSRIDQSRISPWIQNILRLSVFQLLFLDRVPGYAVVNEGVRLARKYEGIKATGFVNGILRNIMRNPDRAKVPEGSNSPIASLSIKYSHPEWMIEDLASVYGIGFTAELCRANNDVPGISIRVNTFRCTRDELASILVQEGLTVEYGRYSQNSLIVKQGFVPFDSNAFKQGLYYVQDQSSMLAVETLNPQPGQLVIDLCSAPGGKATYAAQLMGDTGRVIARDISPSKLNLVVENCNRLGIRSVVTEVYDATMPDRAMAGKADRVLVDAPCSGLGVIRRRPDIKWNKKREDYTELARLQRNILDNASKLVKPGGELVYSTCTVMPVENEQVYRGFLKDNPRFETVDITNILPKELWNGTAHKGYVQFFPHIHGTDGFFISKMIRRS
jgi:16S rRNA (cytosine967-C5)-methyltransferase